MSGRPERVDCATLSSGATRNRSGRPARGCQPPGTFAVLLPLLLCLVLLVPAQAPVAFAAVPCRCIDSPVKDLIVTRENGGNYLPVELEGDTYEYPPGYGQHCAQHDYGLAPYCNDLNASPDWCTQSWCYIDPESDCSAHDVDSSLYFAPLPLLFSYTLCNSSDSFAPWLEPGTVRTFKETVSLVERLLYRQRDDFQAALASLPQGAPDQNCTPVTTCPCTTCSFHTIWRGHVDLRESAVLLPPGAKQDYSTLTTPDWRRFRCFVEQTVLPSYTDMAKLEYSFESSHIAYQYFGSEHNAAHPLFPSLHWCNSEQFTPFTFDPRFRPWFSSTIAGPRDIVLIVHSNSMAAGAALNVLQTAELFVKTLSWIDRLRIVLVQADGPMITFPSTGMAQMTAANVEIAVAFVQTNLNANPTSTSAGTLDQHFADALQPGAFRDEACSRSVILLTAGQPTFADGTGNSVLTSVALEPNLPVFVLALSADTPMTYWQSLSCASNGIAFEWRDSATIRSTLPAVMGEFWSFVRPTCHVNFTPYSDAVTGEPLMGACMAVFDAVAEEYAGVDCIDLNLILPLRLLQSCTYYAEFEAQLLAAASQCAESPMPTDCEIQRLRAEKEVLGAYVCPGGPNAATCADFTLIDLPRTSECKNQPTHDLEAYPTDGCRTLSSESELITIVVAVLAGALFFLNVGCLVGALKSRFLKRIMRGTHQAAGPGGRGAFDSAAANALSFAALKPTGADRKPSRASVVPHKTLGPGADWYRTVKDPRDALFQAVIRGDVIAFRYIRHHNPELAEVPVDAIRVAHQNSLLHVAVSSSHRPFTMTRFLIALGHDPSLPNGRGLTPLHKAAALGRREVLWTLLNAGAKTNLQDHEGNTALLLAIQADAFDIAQCLIEAGANIHMANDSGTTPAAAAVRSGNPAQAALFAGELATLVRRAEASTSISNWDYLNVAISVAVYYTEFVLDLLVTVQLWVLGDIAAFSLSVILLVAPSIVMCLIPLQSMTERLVTLLQLRLVYEYASSIQSGRFSVRVAAFKAIITACQDVPQAVFQLTLLLRSSAPHDTTSQTMNLNTALILGLVFSLTDGARTLYFSYMQVRARRTVAGGKSSYISNRRTALLGLFTVANFVTRMALIATLVQLGFLYPDFQVVLYFVIPLFLLLVRVHIGRVFDARLTAFDAFVGLIFDGVYTASWQAFSAMLIWSSLEVGVLMILPLGVKAVYLIRSDSLAELQLLTVSLLWVASTVLGFGVALLLNSSYVHESSFTLRDNLEDNGSGDLPGLDNRGRDLGIKTIITVNGSTKHVVTSSPSLPAPPEERAVTVEGALGGGAGPTPSQSPATRPRQSLPDFGGSSVGLGQQGTAVAEIVSVNAIDPLASKHVIGWDEAENVADFVESLGERDQLPLECVCMPKPKRFSDAPEGDPGVPCRDPLARCNRCARMGAECQLQGCGDCQYWYCDSCKEAHMKWSNFMSSLVPVDGVATGANNGDADEVVFAAGMASHRHVIEFGPATEPVVQDNGGLEADFEAPSWAMVWRDWVKRLVLVPMIGLSFPAFWKDIKEVPSQVHLALRHAIESRSQQARRDRERRQLRRKARDEARRWYRGGGSFRLFRQRSLEAVAASELGTCDKIMKELDAQAVLAVCMVGTFIGLVASCALPNAGVAEMCAVLGESEGILGIVIGTSIYCVYLVDALRCRTAKSAFSS